MKILIAEDDLTSRIMLQGVLSKWGYEVTSASDAEEAWDVFQQADAPRLVILDWMMPGMDGLTLCRKLRAQDRAAPLYILLLTSKGEQNDIVRGLEAGADDYVAKPYDNEELRARIGVGQRVLELLAEVARRQKLQGVLEMAGAVCHELNQPLHVVSGYSEMLLMDLDESDPQAETLRIIKEQVDRIGALTRKIMSITQYRAKDYLGGRHAIVDIEQASLGTDGMDGADNQTRRRTANEQ
jgi:CheY-like chemotaxis protein